MILTESTESQCLQKMTEVEDWSEGLSTIRLNKGYPNLQTIPFFTIVKKDFNPPLPFEHLVDLF